MENFFFKIRGNPVSWQTALALNMRFDLKTQFNQRPPKWTRRVSTGGHDLTVASRRWVKSCPFQMQQTATLLCVSETVSSFLAFSPANFLRLTSSQIRSVVQRCILHAMSALNFFQRDLRQHPVLSWRVARKHLSAFFQGHLEKHILILHLHAHCLQHRAAMTQMYCNSGCSDFPFQWASKNTDEFPWRLPDLQRPVFSRWPWFFATDKSRFWLGITSKCRNDRFAV